MTAEDWNAIAGDYSGVQDTRRAIVFPYVHEWLRRTQPKRLLDYGAGDGMFARECADLSLSRLVIYDSAPRMRTLARQNISSVDYAEVVDSLSDGGMSGGFDVVTFHAVWMCLSTEEECQATLGDIHRLLRSQGVLIASVTHPCFRDRQFATFDTDFKQSEYLRNGTQFTVNIHDGTREIHVVDTHWNWMGMSRQLKTVGFAIEEVVELADVDGCGMAGAPWAVLVARRS